MEGGIQTELINWMITQINSMMEEKQGSDKTYKDQMERLIIQEKSTNFCQNSFNRKQQNTFIALLNGRRKQGVSINRGT